MKYFLTAVAILFSFLAHASGFEENAKIGEIFRNAGVNGTFVLYDVSAQKYAGYNGEGAEKRFVPASTFKIPNSLIGLAVGVVKDVDEVLPYRGHEKPFSEAWEKDMGLRLCPTCRFTRNLPGGSVLSACGRTSCAWITGIKKSATPWMPSG